MKTSVATLIATAALLVASCAPEGQLLKSSGDMATIKINGDRTVEVELLFFQDGLLYAMRYPAGAQTNDLAEVRIVAFEVKDIQSLKINGYANRKWQTTMILFQGIPTILLMGAGASIEGSNVGAIFLVFGLPTLVTYGIFEASTPATPGAEAPLTASKMESLKCYMRFPEGLNPTQFELFLNRVRNRTIERMQ